jgi:hypothetical protein
LPRSRFLLVSAQSVSCVNGWRTYPHRLPFIHSKSSRSLCVWPQATRLVRLPMGRPWGRSSGVSKVSPGIYRQIRFRRGLARG